MRFSLFAIVAAVFSLGATVACSDSASSTAAPSTTADPSTGESLVKANACASCHGDDFGGKIGIPGYPSRNAPNITPDKTGVGEWTAEQLTTAIVKGVDDEGKQLCGVMPKFSRLSSDDEAKIVTYLRALPAVSRDIADSDCPADAGK